MNKFELINLTDDVVCEYSLISSYACVCQRLEAERLAREELERQEAERQAKLVREEQEKQERKKVSIDWTLLAFISLIYCFLLCLRLALDGTRW